MKAFCDEIGIDCTSTPFSKREADFLVDNLNSPFIKVASMDLNNYPFLEYLAKKDRPIILSTGLSEMYEIDKAIRTIENAGNNKIVILHCVSIYPPKDEQVNLRNILTLQKIYPNYPIGFSDHTLGTSIPIASVALGVCVIEKHFTLDKNMFGWDHKVSATKDEMALIVSESQRVNAALGDFRISCVEDQERKTSFRRSIISTRAIKKGEIINEVDIDFKRPGDDIAPEFINFVVGRIASRDIEADKPIPTPPDTFKAPLVVDVETDVEPIETDPPIPTPPAVTIDPVVADVLAVEDVILRSPEALKLVIVLDADDCNSNRFPD